MTVGRRRVTEAERSLAEFIIIAWNEAFGTSLTPVRGNLSPVIGRIREHPEMGLMDHKVLIQRCKDDSAPFWSEERPGLRVLYGHGGVFEGRMNDTGVRRAKGAAAETDRRVAERLDRLRQPAPAVVDEAVARLGGAPQFALGPGDLEVE